MSKSIQCGAKNGRRIVRGQEKGYLGNLVRMHQMAQVGFPVNTYFIHHTCIYGTRTDGVHINAVVSLLSGNGLGEIYQCSLGSPVRTSSGCTHRSNEIWETGQPVSKRVRWWKEIPHSEIMRLERIVTVAT